MYPLDQFKDQDNSAYIGWADTPNAFVIYDANELAKSVLPRYFKHNNLSSFIRQLNIYNFDKIKTDQNIHLYHHPCLCEGDKNMLKKIQRKHPENQRKKLCQMSDDSSFNPIIFAGKTSPVDVRVQENVKNQHKLNILESQKQFEIKQVTKFFTLLLKNHSAIGFQQIDQIRDIFNNAEKRKQLLEKFNFKDNNPLCFNFDLENHLRREISTKEERASEQSENSLQMQNFENQQANAEQKCDQNQGNEDQGFLPLEVEQQYDRNCSMKYQKLFE